MKTMRERDFMLRVIFLLVTLGVLLPFSLRASHSISQSLVAGDPPIVQQVTGGGWILNCLGDKCTFGFNAEELASGTLRGNVEYVDHSTGYPHVHGYDITGLSIIGNEATIEGVCRLNGDRGPYDFRVFVRDFDEPGKYDWFEIWVDIGYHCANELGFPDDAGGGGNIQIHRPAP